MAKAPRKIAGQSVAARVAAEKAVSISAEPELLDGIFVRSLAPTFRRAGFTFTREGVGLLLANLSPQQLDAIEAEPLLSVTQAQFPATAEADAQLAELAKAQAEAGGDGASATAPGVALPPASMQSKDGANGSADDGSGAAPGASGAGADESEKTEGNA